MKRKNAAESLAAEELAMLTLPGNKEEGTYLYFDHTGLINDYKNKLSYAHARYAALRKDYEALQAQYISASNKPIIPSQVNIIAFDMKNETLPDATGTVSYQETLKTKLDEQMAQVAELARQNEILNAALVNTSEKNLAISRQLEEERMRVSNMEETLLANRQLLQHLYKEFDEGVDESEVAPVVIPIPPVYVARTAADY